MASTAGGTKGHGQHTIRNAVLPAFPAADAGGVLLDNQSGRCDKRILGGQGEAEFKGTPVHSAKDTDGNGDGSHLVDRFTLGNLPDLIYQGEGHTEFMHQQILGKSSP